MVLLVEHGADPNASGMEGDTPLHDAAISAHIDVAKFLLDKGAVPVSLLVQS